MLVGCYYRCPIAIEENDKEYPRFFVLAQCAEYDELADVIRVEMHDLLGSSTFYEDLFSHTVFHAKDVVHCEAIPGATVDSAWGRGIIAARAKEPGTGSDPFWYWIKLQDGHFEKACETGLSIEYSQMNYSPAQQLRSYEFQHPTWFVNYLKVSRNQHITNNAIFGFPVLAGSRAFLMPHQISTVARCFETMPIRYMLADEVGLGKTIEACSILSILTSENSQLRTLIIAPGALVTQWKNELHYKFNLEAEISSAYASICILPMEELNSASVVLALRWDLVIVDETHRLLNQNKWYNQVQTLSEEATHLLLLSATPIQDRNEEYHRLLSLLNPEQYKNMSSERFAWMVRKQKQIQKTVNLQLNRLNRYEEYKEIIADKLHEVAETLDDSALKAMVNSIDLTANDLGLEAVKQALAYICENYRIERKVIRNRRQIIMERMAKRCLLPLPYVPLSVDENYNEIGAIQSTMSYLTANSTGSHSFITEVAIPLMSSLFSSPWAFERTLCELKIQDGILLGSAVEWKQQAISEHAHVNIALDEDPDLIKGRLMTALNYIDQETDVTDDANCKIVVFTAHNATLTEFLELFNNRYEIQGIRAVGFGKHMTRSELEDSVYEFQNDESCRVIVCDETGGEGRNFQIASQIIHLDIPWSANALEQRIGRLDRLGRDPDMDVTSVVLVAEGTVEEQLFHIWRDGLKLFNQSLSGLEIITGELNGLILEALEDDFENGLNNAFDEILDQAEEMRESVEDEQDFDLGATLYRPLNQGVEHVLSVYAGEDDNIFASAMLGWGHQVGLSPEYHPEDLLVEFNADKFSVNAAKQSLFIPPNWEHYNSTAIMKRKGKILGSFDRKTASVREDILFYAPGDPVYDAIIRNALSCSRGRCAAIGTQANYNYDGLVYIYNVETSIDQLLSEGLGLETLAQYKMYLPLSQIIVPVALNAQSRAIPEATVIETLLGLRARDCTHLGKRSSGRLSMSPLERFIGNTPPDIWEPLVDKCTEIAYKRARKKLHEEADIDAARNEMQRVLNGYRAECLFFERDPAKLAQKDRVFQATFSVLQSAKPVLDAVCFLKVRMNG